MKKFFKSNWSTFLMLSLTIGLLPFNPPHIWDKLKWIAGGNAFSGPDAMKGLDYFDVLMHGTPWVLLLLSGIFYASDLFKTKSPQK